MPLLLLVLVGGLIGATLAANAGRGAPPRAKGWFDKVKEFYQG
jgi:hypothetical protein